MRKVAFSILIISLIFTLELKSQTTSDSLQALLREEISDTIRIDILGQLSEVLLGDNPNQAISYATEGSNIAKEINDKRRLAKMLKNIGLGYYYQADYVEVLGYWKNSLAVFEEINDSKGISNLLGNIGAVYYNTGDDPKALNYYLKALRIADQNNDPVRKATLLQNIGAVYLNTREYSLSKEYFEKALIIFRSIKYEAGIGTALINLSNIYIELDSIQQASLVIEEAKTLLKSSNTPTLVDALAMSSRIKKQKGEDKEALLEIQEAFQIAEKQGHKFGMLNAMVTSGSIYLDINNPDLAISAFKKAINISAEIGDESMYKQSAYEGLINAYRMSGNIDKVATTQDSLLKINKQLYEQENDKKLSNLQLQYDLQNRETKISELNALNKLQEAQVEKARTSRNFFLSLLGFLLLTSIGIIVQFQITKKSRQRKRALEEQTKINQQLKHIDQLKDQFLANTSHELRTPLNGIIGLSDSLIDGVSGELPKEAVNNLIMIAASGKRLAVLVNDILDFSKLKNFDVQLHLKPIDLFTIVEVVIKNNEPLIKGRHLKLINDIPRDLSAAKADENRLQQILFNLIGNAIKFTDSGFIKISAVERNDKIIVSVSDTGIGIPDHKKESIFKAFEQGDGSISRTFDGTGLGLNISKRLVELHGGEMWMESKLGKGSTFFFNLPITKEKPIPATSNPTVARILSSTTFTDENELKLSVNNNGEVKVLIVDDDAINQQVLKNYLIEKQYFITQVLNGVDAIKEIGSNKKYDLVLLDVMMPRMSGYEVCQKIRKKYLPSELPIIMVTAKNQVQDLVQGLSYGANDYLTKPFSKNEFLARIKTHLNLHRINEATSKFVPNEFLSSLGRDNITEVQLGDHITKEVTVLFSDIRAYTSLSEQMSLKQNFKFVQKYNGQMGPIIQVNNGFVNQYLGDGIMAIFPNSPEHALNAAIQMQQKLNTYNDQRVKENRNILKVGIGIHSGSLIMGIVGDNNRMEATTISDTVNTASRIENLTKHYGASILISSSSIKNLSNPDLFNFRYLGEVQVKGKQETVQIFECIDGDLPEVKELKLASLAHFKEGVQYYFAQSFPKAALSFDLVLKQNPRDRTAKLFLNKVGKLITSGVDEDWTGIETMEIK